MSNILRSCYIIKNFHAEIEMISLMIFLNFFKIIRFKSVVLCQFAEFNIDFIFSSAISSFDIEINLRVSGVNRRHNIGLLHCILNPSGNFIP